MFESKYLGSFLQKESTEDFNKEKEVESIVQDMLGSDMELNRSVMSKFMLASMSNAMVLLFFVVMMDGMSWFIRHERLTPNNDKLLVLCIAFASIVLSPVLVYFIDKYEDKSAAKRLAKLFSTLSDKPYEVRVERTGHRKLKMVVESNFIKNGHVMKEKSQHFTSYIDLKQSTKSIVEFVVDVVKKTESSFK